MKTFFKANYLAVIMVLLLLAANTANAQERDTESSSRLFPDRATYTEEQQSAARRGWQRYQLCRSFGINNPFACAFFLFRLESQ